MVLPNVRNQQTNYWASFGRGKHLALHDAADHEYLVKLPVNDIRYEVLPTEEAVGRAMFDEIVEAAAAKDGALVIVILGGRGGQALHRLLGAIAKTSDHDALLGRLHVFTQDALAPLRMDNGLSFVHDFERLLGEDFFHKVKSFTSIRTDARDLESELAGYVERLEPLGGIDLFFLGLGPEAGGASHLAYIKPGSGARYNDVEGVIEYAETPSSRGLNLMQGPGYDQESTPGLVAAGATVVVFTTGRGTTIGNAITPVIKLASNTPIFERMSNDLDLSAGSVIDGTETIDEVGRRVFDHIVDVANGTQAKAEVHKHREFQFWAEQTVSL